MDNLITCRSCNKAQTFAEQALYGTLCEDCWADRAGAQPLRLPYQQMRDALTGELITPKKCPDRGQRGKGKGAKLG